MAHDVFISYSTKDKIVADATCARLEQNGIRCWIASRDLVPGETWAAAITDAIQQSRVMVLILSKHANASRQILCEADLAVSLGVAIIPMRIEDILPGRDLKFYLSSTHWLDAFPPPMDKHLDRVAIAVQGVLKLAQTMPPVISETAKPPRASGTSVARRATFVAIASVLMAGLIFAAICSVRIKPKPVTTPASVPTQGAASAPDEKNNQMIDLATEYVVPPGMSDIVNAGEKANAEQRFKDAEAEFNKLRVSYPNSIYALVKVGVALINQDRLNEAEKILQQAYEQAPKNPNACSALGQLYLRLNQEDKALPLLKTAQENDPNDEQAAGAIGSIYLNKGQFKEAEDQFNQQIKIDQGLGLKDFKPHVGLAVAYSLQTPPDLDHARQDY